MSQLDHYVYTDDQYKNYFIYYSEVVNECTLANGYDSD